MTEKTPPLPKVVPCGGCRKTPRFIEEGYMCETCHCPVSYVGRIRCPVNWNYLQDMVLDLRRKDFEAARERIKHPGDNWGAFSLLKYQTFDDYLAERKA